MKYLFLDVYNNKLKTVEANGLDDYYKLIGCRTIDIVRRKIGDIDVEIVIDDEGALVEHPKPSAVDIVGEIALYGNLLVASGRVTEDGELTELTKEEVYGIMDNLATITTSVYTEPYKVFVEVDYWCYFAWQVGNNDL